MTRILLMFLSCVFTHSLAVARRSKDLCERAFGSKFILLALVSAMGMAGAAGAELRTDGDGRRLGAAMGEYSGRATTGSSERRFPFPGQGAFVMTVPKDWNTEVPRQSDTPVTTIVVTPAMGKAFRILITPFWTKPKNASAPADSEIRASVERSIADVRGRAVESVIPVRRLKQGSVQGYYFSATDRTPKPGEFKHLVQGTVVCGRLIVAFTVLSNDSSGRIEKEAVAMIGSMRHMW